MIRSFLYPVMRPRLENFSPCPQAEGYSAHHPTSRLPQFRTSSGGAFNAPSQPFRTADCKEKRPHLRRCGKAWRCFKLERLAAEGGRVPDLRSKAGEASGADKTTPEACGAICNGDATSFRGGCEDGAERSER